MYHLHYPQAALFMYSCVNTDLLSFESHRRNFFSFFTKILTTLQLLANRTIGHAFGTLCRLSS